MSPYTFAIICFLASTGVVAKTTKDPTAARCNFGSRNPAALLYGDEICSCLPCYEGQNCDQPVKNCTVDLTAALPFVEQYYLFEKSDAVITTPLWFRPTNKDGAFVPNPYTAQIIRDLHQKVGNFEVADKTVVFSTGAGSLIKAIIESHTQLRGKSMNVYIRPPYYFQFPDYVSSAKASLTTALDLDPDDVIEIVTNPNNPTNSMLTPQYPKASLIIWDFVGYWPLYKAIDVARNEDVGVFSLSKVANAGSSFGWAWFKDANLASKVTNNVVARSSGVSADSQFRAFGTIHQILNDDQFFPYTFTRINSYFERAQKIIDGQKSPARFALESEAGKFIWLRCLYENEDPCLSVFQSVGIDAYDGTIFGADSRFVRFSLPTYDHVAEIFFERFEKLVQ